MIFPRPVTVTDALRSSGLRRVLPLAPSIGTRDIQEFIPAQVRARAFFSARTPYASYLDSTHKMITRMVQPDVRITSDGIRAAVKGESISPAQVRARMKRMLTALDYQPDPAKRGGLQDLSSDMRINLIIDTQLKTARGYGQWRQAQDETILDLWPADELYRAIPRDNERDWQERWNRARHDLGSATSATLAQHHNGPFVARKNDPIWSRISRFGNPYPPFDFRSGMRVRDVSRGRAIELQVMDAGGHVRPTMDPLNERVEIAMQDTRTDIAAALQAAFGERARLEDGRLFIIPEPQATITEILHRADLAQQATGAIAFATETQRTAAARMLASRPAAGATIDVAADDVRHMLSGHGGQFERLRGQVPLKAEDVERIPSLVASGNLRLPLPHELRKPGPNDVTMEAAGGYRLGMRYAAKANRFMIRTMWRMQ